VIEEKTIAAAHVLAPNTAPPAPEKEKQIVAYNTPPVLPSRPPAAIVPAPAVLSSRSPAAVAPASGQIATVKIPAPMIPAPKTPGMTAPAAGTLMGTKDVSRVALLPLPDEAGAASGAKPVDAPSGPTVTYRDGQLTIDAQNATLAEVLKLVAEKSGAKIEVPPGSGLERIFEHAGPGPAQAVLVSLLNGSPYDFVIVSSPQAPNTPAQVLLTLRGAEPASAPAANEPVISAAAQPRPASGDPYLWTPPSSPQLYSGDANPIIPRPPAVAPPPEPLSPDVLEQKMKDFNRQLRGGPPPSQ
jgi:hypothetical protein